MQQDAHPSYQQSALSLPFRVRETLRDAGRYDLLAEFFDRAERCVSEGELVRLATEYLPSA